MGSGVGSGVGVGVGGGGVGVGVGGGGGGGGGRSGGGTLPPTVRNCPSVNVPRKTSVDVRLLNTTSAAPKLGTRQLSRPTVAICRSARSPPTKAVYRPPPPLQTSPQTAPASPPQKLPQRHRHAAQPGHRRHGREITTRPPLRQPHHLQNRPRGQRPTRRIRQKRRPGREIVTRNQRRVPRRRHPPAKSKPPAATADLLKEAQNSSPKLLRHLDPLQARAHDTARSIVLSTKPTTPMPRALRRSMLLAKTFLPKTSLAPPDSRNEVFGSPSPLRLDT